MATFSSPRQQLRNLSRTQQDEVDGIFRRLSDTQSQMSFGLGGEQYDCTHSRWYWSDTALIENCKSGTYAVHAIWSTLSSESNLSSLL